MACARGCCATQAEHFRSLKLNPRLRGEGSNHHREFALGADRDAYRSMRRQGLQPPRLMGSYDLARRAESETEVRLGRVVKDDPTNQRRGRRFLENMVEIADHGMTGEVVRPAAP
jgi:hypothetical protein